MPSSSTPSHEGAFAPHLPVNDEPLPQDANLWNWLSPVRDDEPFLTHEAHLAFNEHQDTIHRCKVEIARALRAINEQELYAERSESFDDFCEEHLGIHRRRAADVIGWLELREACARAGVTELPSRLSHYRALRDLTRDQQVEVWREVVWQNGGAHHVSRELLETTVAWRKQVWLDMVLLLSPTPSYVDELDLTGFTEQQQATLKEAVLIAERTKERAIVHRVTRHDGSEALLIAYQPWRTSAFPF